MNLILSSGYPFPYPPNLPPSKQHELSMAAPSYRLVIEGVKNFEQKHTTTVEFIDDCAFHAAQAITGWATWSDRVLEAPTSAEDGYDFPAIVVGAVAYCAHQLVDVEPTEVPLFYVRDADGDQDLLVRVGHPMDALNAWRKHYEQSIEDNPTYVAPVPLDLLGAIDWDRITSKAFQFKPMPD